MAAETVPLRRRDASRERCHRLTWRGCSSRGYSRSKGHDIALRHQHIRETLSVREDASVAPLIVSRWRHAFWHARRAMDDVRVELLGAEDEVRQQAASLRQRARRLRVRGFVELAAQLDAHAAALQETADAIATQLE